MGHSNKKQSKGAISLAKRKNIKGGKMASGKKTKSKNVTVARRKLQVAVKKKMHQKKFPNDPSNSKPPEPDVHMNDVLDMINEDDLAHLRGDSFKDRQYLVTSQMSRMKPQKGGGRKRKKQGDDDNLESQYEHRLADMEESAKNIKMLLPLKTSGGLQMQSHEVEEEEEEDEEVFKTGIKNGTKSQNKKKKSDDEFTLKDAVVSLGKLVAQRRSALLQYKLRIGTLASAFLEDPEHRMKNLDALLAIMDAKDPAVAFTVPKLSALSLLTVFRDALPSYPIKHSGSDGVKLKKDTLHLQTSENLLLSKYKMYLKKLEQLVTKYCPRKRDKIPLSSVEASLGEVALECMCGMLLTHPYFNMSVNIVNFVIPFLNNWNSVVRKIIFNAIKTVFRVDKRGEISYEMAMGGHMNYSDFLDFYQIVRRINDLVKSYLGKKGGRVVQSEVLDVLLALRIKEVNLENERDEEMKSTKKLTFEQRRMLSKRQRKKSKELVLLEKELLEASAEENKTRKSHYLTEVTKLVFTIYFRALKTNPNQKLLSAVLEGLSKFAHVINVDFFDDLLKVLERLLKGGELHQRQMLLCIATVFGVLDGQGAALTLDPTAFHKYLYVALSNLRCGKTETDVGLALRCIELATGKKKMPGPRAIAFAKRLATTSLQLEHHDAAGAVMELKQVLRLHPSVAMLLDCDGSGASGVYLPELDDPDHCCANASTMWELTSLMSHYHPWVAQVAKTVVDPKEKVPVEIVRSSPNGICRQFDPSQTLDFTPAPPERKLINYKSKTRYPQFKARTEYFREELDVKTYLDESADTLDYYPVCQ